MSQGAKTARNAAIPALIHQIVQARYTILYGPLIRNCKSRKPKSDLRRTVWIGSDQEIDDHVAQSIATRVRRA